MRVDRGAQVLDEQVRVGSRRHAHVAVAHEPLDAVDVDPLAQELGGEGVPQIVETHLERQRLGPQQAAADLLRWLAGAVGALHAVGAVAPFAVLVTLLVAAPAAAMFPAFRDTGARKRVAEDLLWVGLARPLRTIGHGEEQVTRRVLHLVLDPRPQWRGQRQDCGGVALRRLAIMGASDGDRATVEIDVALCQRKQLAFAEAEGGPACEERAPALRDLLEHPRELL